MITRSRGRSPWPAAALVAAALVVGPVVVPVGPAGAQAVDPVTRQAQIEAELANLRADHDGLLVAEAALLDAYAQALTAEAQAQERLETYRSQQAAALGEAQALADKARAAAGEARQARAAAQLAARREAAARATLRRQATAAYLSAGEPGVLAVLVGGDPDDLGVAAVYASALQDRQRAGIEAFRAARAAAGEAAARAAEAHGEALARRDDVARQAEELAGSIAAAEQAEVEAVRAAGERGAAAGSVQARREVVAERVDVLEDESASIAALLRGRGGDTSGEVPPPVPVPPPTSAPPAPPTTSAPPTAPPAPAPGPGPVPTTTGPPATTAPAPESPPDTDPPAPTTTAPPAAPARLAPPVQPARITSPFGPRLHPILGEWRMHTGVDMDADQGQAILAAGAGEVVSASEIRGYGMTVIVDHGGGVATLYAHLSSYAVGAGERVAAGQRVGGAGATGLATGPHLHFEVRVDGEPVDPAPWIGMG